MLNSIGLFVTLVDDCNLSCKFCVFPNKKKFRNGNQLDFDKFITMIKESKKDSVIPINSVCFCGSGEPLLYDKLTEIVYETKKYVPFVSIVTNGVLLEQNISEKLILSKVDTVVVSVTGIDNLTYIKFQGSRKGEEESAEQLEIVKKNIMNFIQIRNKLFSTSTIGISYILSPDSKMNYSYALKYWKDIGVNYVDTRILSTGFSLKHRDFEEDLRINSSRWETCCTCFGKVMNVFTDGRLGYCNCAYVDETILGNIYEKPLKELIMGDKFQSLIKCFYSDYSNIPNFCKKCDLRRARPILA